MKKLAALMLGMSLMAGTVTLFAQDTKDTSKTTAKKHHKKAKPTTPAQ
jgi:hypothetical protein